MTRHLFIWTCFLLLFVQGFSQEGLRALSGRINSMPQEINAEPRFSHNQSAHKTQAVGLQLPFIDDFSYSSTQIYPRLDLWLDSSVYVNSGFAKAPPSLGVATFDGLNKYGYPYNINYNPNIGRPADTLTSRPINLHTLGSQTLQVGANIGMSFYYQARGYGDPPEVMDSLLLDFFKPRQKVWVNVWGVPGNSSSNTNDSAFKRVFIRVDTLTTDTAYLQEDFQFRFRNKATTAGDFDHWHLDYLFLDANRQRSDTLQNDITFGSVPTSWLRDYWAMPYRQFTASEMAPKQSVRIRNNGNAPVNMTYENNLRTYPANAVLNHYNGGSDILAPFTSTSGYSSYPLHANPAINYTFGPMSSMTDYKVQHYIYRSSGGTSDFITGNDTVIQYQLFRNYFALDDGSAEVGYYVNGVGGKMAIKFTLNATDTLKALQIYFDPAGYGYSDTLAYRFRVHIWDAGPNWPGTDIYKDSLRYAKYAQKYSYKVLPEYKLTTPRVLTPGTYYVGIEQRVASGISVGFDRNSDRHTSVYYDSGQGWQQSGFAGAPMIRPVFGSEVVLQGIHESALSKRLFLVYPNPTSNDLTLTSEQFESASYTLMNALGQVVMQDNIRQSVHHIDTHDLSGGVYFLSIRNSKGLVQQQKIIIQH